MIILINRNMSYECIKPMANRSDTLPKEQMKCIMLSFLLYFVHSVFLYDLSNFLSSFKSNIPLNKETSQLFLIVAPILSLLKPFRQCITQYYKVYENSWIAMKIYVQTAISTLHKPCKWFVI